MKKNLLSFLTAIALTSSVIVAQPTLTATGINPVIGDAYSLKYGSSASQGSAGANQTWTVIPATTNTVINYVTSSVGSTPNGASFSQSNFSFNGSGSYGYYNTSASALANCGQTAGGVVMSYSNTEELLHFPFNMGNTYTDTWAVNFTNGVSFARTGTTTVTYDGYGTITLATGTYSNAVRVHFQQTYSDAYSGGTINYTNDQYMWYLNGNHMPIAVTYTLTNSISGSSSATIILANIAVSVQEYSKLFSNIITFPNPANDEINLKATDNIAVSTVEIMDIAGKVVYTQAVSGLTTNETIHINTSDLNNGIYFVKLTTETGETGTQKISIIK